MFFSRERDTLSAFLAVVAFLTNVRDSCCDWDKPPSGTHETLSKGLGCSKRGYVALGAITSVVGFAGKSLSYFSASPFSTSSGMSQLRTISLLTKANADGEIPRVRCDERDCCCVDCL